MSIVSREIFEGLYRLSDIRLYKSGETYFSNVVVKGAFINSFPPVPPLPVTVTLLSVALPPNELIPTQGIEKEQI